MTLQLNTATSVPEETEFLIIGVFEGSFDAAYSNGIDPKWLEADSFSGKKAQSLKVNLGGRTIFLVGLGNPKECDSDNLRRASAVAVKAATNSGSAVLLGPMEQSNDLVGDSRAIAEGLLLGSYKYNEFKSKAEPAKLASVTVVGADASGLEEGKRIGEAVCLARDLVNGPPGRSTPTRLAEVASEVAAANGLDVKVYDENDIEREGFGGLRGVSMGSGEPPRLVELTYVPEGTPTATIAFVGKGITFDSGGLSLKPAAGMMTMKTDMSGAAAVISAMSVIGAMKPSVKVIGIICATENLPGPKATKPGDVLKARNGKTMEVLNTDAEGRLVLADGLSLAAEANVDAIIDLATLTGACVVALGGEIAGLMSNNDEFSERVKTAADAAGEQTWPLPLPKRYRKHIDSDVADIKNIGASGGAAGALTAGLFLQEFVNDIPWVHLDIAGPARADGDDGYTAKGGTGFGVRTLIELARSYS